MKIYAPVKDANGVYASVRFVNGVGETDNPHLIKWFKSHGYKVPLEEPNVVIEPTNDEIEIENDEVVDEEPNFDDMSVNELREYLKTKGFGTRIGNTRNKEKLLEFLRG